MTWLKTIIINLCRLLLAGTFLFSGFVKAADPLGMVYKVQAYLNAWQLNVPSGSFWLTLAAGTLAVAEFMLGINLLLGMWKRLTATLSFFFMLAMTGITIYINATDAVADCGCFGDAVTLTNAQTLAKNIILLIATLPLLRQRKLQFRLISERRQWILSIFSLIYVIALTVFSHRHLPLVDFTGFRTGLNIPAAIAGDYGTRIQQKVGGFSLWDGETDLTDSLLACTKPAFFIVSPNLNDADDGVSDRLADLYDFCSDNDFPLAALTPHEPDDPAVVRWRDLTGATYPLLYADEELLKALVRSNPGVVLLQEGTLTRKWGKNDLPDWTKIQSLNAARTGKELPSAWTGIIKLLLWFAIPLIFIIFADRMWIFRTIKRKFKETNNNKKPNIIMRKKIVAGNWKMNKNLQEGIELAKELRDQLAAEKPNCGVVICTPFIHLASVAAELQGSVIGLGAENCADKAKGAYTGEVSAEMVKSTGAQYVILGHSERRAYYNETAEILKEKVSLALENGLEVIFCIGELLEERKSVKQNEVVQAQLAGSLFDLTPEQFKHIILAYEPVWAIGTGETATAEQAEDMHAFIRGVIAEKFGADVADDTTILYGGSCKPSNAKELFAKPDVDGGLIGGASLKAADFKGIIDAWN